MLYKGNDLDLRAPYAPGTEEGGLQVGWLPISETGRDGPIPVDPTVLACCNAAYDAALFHGARDVRVEHLLYALTRVEAAREILEQHGVRIHSLRRDAAAAIAAEAPAAGGAGRTPRASAEFENVLRRAAGRAGQDSVPASVHDIMRAVLSYGREATATQLFLRSASDPQQLERWAAEPRSLLPPHAASLPHAVTQELIARLEAVEGAMRSLAAEVAADRKAMLDLVSEIHHELRATREAEAGARPAVVLEKIDDVGRSVAALSERFDDVRALARSDEGTSLAARVHALESSLSEQPSAVAQAVAYMLSEQQNNREAPLALTADATSPAPADLADRLAALEAAVHKQTAQLEEASKGQEHDLNEIFEALVKLGTNQQTLGSNLEAWRLDGSGDISILSNRLETMDRTLQELVSPRPVRVIKEAPAASERESEGNGRGPNRSFKRWLYGTGKVLPSSWREDAAAIRESFRSARRLGKS